MCIFEVFHERCSCAFLTSCYHFSPLFSLRIKHRDVALALACLQASTLGQELVTHATHGMSSNLKYNIAAIDITKSKPITT